MQLTVFKAVGKFHFGAGEIPELFTVNGIAGGGIFKDTSSSFSVLSESYTNTFSFCKGGKLCFLLLILLLNFAKSIFRSIIGTLAIVLLELKSAFFKIFTNKCLPSPGILVFSIVFGWLKELIGTNLTVFCSLVLKLPYEVHLNYQNQIEFYFRLITLLFKFKFLKFMFFLTGDVGIKDRKFVTFPFSIFVNTYLPCFGGTRIIFDFKSFEEIILNLGGFNVEIPLLLIISTGFNLGGILVIIEFFGLMCVVEGIIEIGFLIWPDIIVGTIFTLDKTVFGTIFFVHAL
ncbi:hypothetical protein AGLY_015496 [Aphis glycines]|uniref:Uncharacterized protein n=1 Tax=Aphis glycines TaxID=307491 RepID=A0A6G0T2I3_APHGL|nr:hypothetical protein AGLY_015496 [Aphis glycines]